MTALAYALVAAGPLFDPGPVLPEDLAHPQGIEVSRIQRHLSHVEASLRRTAPPDATPEALAARERALDALHDYWTAGVFPENRDFPDRRVPYFIDADGTACAVGHLMIASGDAAIAREIATYENNDFLAEIDHPGVEAWLARNALTAEEAAWIQPAYDPCGGVNPSTTGTEQPPVCGADGNSYACEAVASQCGVEVDGEGLCPGHGADDIVEWNYGECAGGTGTGTETGTDTGGEPDDEGGDDEGGDKGCRVADPPAAVLLLLLLALVRRRRR